MCAGVQGAPAPGQVQVRLPRPGVRLRPRLPARHTPGHEEAHLPAPGDDDDGNDDNSDDDDDDDSDDDNNDDDDNDDDDDNNDESDDCYSLGSSTRIPGSRQSWCSSPSTSPLTAPLATLFAEFLQVTR